MRGARPLVQARRLLVSAASAGTGFLLLAALGHALGHGAGPGSGARLAWCLVPLAATVYVAVAVARADPVLRPEQTRNAYGLGNAGTRALAGVATAAFCALGSLVALLAFLVLRGNVMGRPLGEGAADALGQDYALPLGGVLALLTLVPAVASVAAALLAPRAATDPRPPGPDGATADPAPPATAPAGLPWGVALLTAGLAVQAYTARTGKGTGGLLSDNAPGGPGGALAGWALIAVGLAVAGPGLTYWCGRALQWARPGAVRLLAGRGLQEEARRIGRPLGVVCALAAAFLAALQTRDGVAGGGALGQGPLVAFGVTLVATCALAALLMATVESRQTRAETTSTLQRAGAPVATLRVCAAVRAVALLAVLTPLAWAVAVLATLPLSH